MAEREVPPPQSCILFATADWDEPYWTNKQHCAKSLADLGTKVLYVESVGLRSPKAGSRKDWKRLWNRLSKGLVSLIFGAPERSTGIYVLSPLLIPAGHRHALTRQINRLLLKAAIIRSTWGKRFNQPLIWTYHPFMLEALNGGAPGALIYHCVDDLSAVPGIDAQAFRIAEDALICRANAVFATAPSLVERCKRLNPNTYYLANVVDADHFSKAMDVKPLPADLADIPEPRIGYHGVLSDFKVDFQLLLDAAKIRKDWSWIFIGEEREGQQSELVAELANLSNVRFLGYRSYRELPDYLRGVQVGMIPSLLNEYTRSMFPMKYYEYIAAGVPVVSTRLPFLEEKTNLAEIFIDANSLIAAVEKQLSRDKISREASKAAVSGNTWAVRTRKMLDLTFGFSVRDN
ncbi:glycosyltransferase [Uliginosibacterium sp. 31-12]|uniref:glycosyltransferase n=1 Tax=Uliginosibacterium sp. 31-12 TaxID=3062781 RepID=UPI0026E2716E|nr:glycosyltransferase [Uliginosibacterium sp. 31-12]MDO6388175.1 glycosyltransferase [Uliginosibacterium sp. 31-12]